MTMLLTHLIYGCLGGIWRALHELHMFAECDLLDLRDLDRHLPD